MISFVTQETAARFLNLAAATPYAVFVDLQVTNFLRIADYQRLILLLKCLVGLPSGLLPPHEILTGY